MSRKARSRTAKPREMKRNTQDIFYVILEVFFREKNLRRPCPDKLSCKTYTMAQ